MPCTPNFWKALKLAKRSALTYVSRVKAWAMIEETRDRLEHVDYVLDYAVRQAKDIFLGAAENVRVVFAPAVAPLS